MLTNEPHIETKIVFREVCCFQRVASRSQSSGRSLLISPSRYLNLLLKLNLNLKQQIKVRVIRKEVGWSWRAAYRIYKCVLKSLLFPRSGKLDSESVERKCADFKKPHVEITIVFRDVCRADVLARFLARTLLILPLRFLAGLLERL